MRGAEVYSVLREKSIVQLHHANTVTTSCTFLQSGGLASRGYVKDRGLTQTPQYTDTIDQQFGIWYDLFMDTVDIHDRARSRNLYGPVLFVMDAEVLNSLPRDTEVIVTRKNPTKWVHGEPLYERSFTSTEEMRKQLQRGTFGQMIVIRTPDGILPFPRGGPAHRAGLA